MHISSGARLGPYEVLELLGRGGMGQVYRARDSRLHRDVAIKIILPELSTNEHLGRFRREAQSLAALTHPNVASVYDLAEIEGTAFLVMELVGGPTLAERLAAGPLPIEDAIRTAEQVAAALDAVHEKGIIHRDLKPSNIKLGADGTVKVLDFGLAKVWTRPAMQPAETAVTFGTVDGVIVGTAAYMSPEQARGWEVDRRTDIWAFGCVLYEMLTGRPAFAAATIADTIAAVLARDPDWTAVPASTPSTTTRLLRRCLHRNVAQRLRDIGDARLDLQDAAAEYESPRDLAVTDAPLRSRGSAVIVATVLAIGLALGAGAVWILRPPPPSSVRPAHFTVPLPATALLGGLDFPTLALSPDGSRLVYVGNRGGQTQLFVRTLNALEPEPVAGTINAVAPFFSPDSRWVAFFADGELKKVALEGGGPPIRICEAQVGLGGSWNAADVIVFASSTGSGLSQVPASGGTPQRVTTLDVANGEFSHRWPEWLPDGRTILYTVGTAGSWNDAHIVAQTPSGERSVVVRGGTGPRYLRSGHLLYAHDARLMMAPFDAGALSLRGNATPVVERLAQSSDGAAQFTVSSAGDLAYVTGVLDSSQRRLVTVTRDGTVTPFAAPLRPYTSPRVSPDGRTLLLVMESSPPDLWTYDVQSGDLTQLTYEASAASPVWSPDGRQAAYSSARAGVPTMFLIDVADPRRAERIAATANAQIPGSWGRDGSMLAFVERRGSSGRDILLLALRDGGVPRLLFASAADESAPRISPDGRWLAYVTNRSGRAEIALRRLSEPPREYQVSIGGGIEPVWAPNGRELFYREGDRLMSAAVPDDGVRVAPRVLFTGGFLRGTADTPGYDVMPDGQRFVMVQQQLAQAVLHMVINWAETSPVTLRP